MYTHIYVCAGVILWSWFRWKGLEEAFKTSKFTQKKKTDGFLFPLVFFCTKLSVKHKNDDIFRFCMLLCESSWVQTKKEGDF